MSLFSAVEMAPRDPILGLNEQFAADQNPAKVNLGVGVYFDENGKLPLLACVQAAEKALMDAHKPRGYLPIDGIAAYDNAVKKLVFGADSDVVKQGRVATAVAAHEQKIHIASREGRSDGFLLPFAFAFAVRQIGLGHGRQRRVGCGIGHFHRQVAAAAVEK